MENQRGCFFNHLFKGFLVGSLQKQMCIEQRYACYLYRKCKSKHLEGAVRLYSQAVKNIEMSHLFSCASDHICLPILILWGCTAPVYSGWCNYPIILYPSDTHTRTHVSPPPPSTFQFQSSACVILFYLASPPPSVPSGVHFSSVDPTTPQPRTWAAHTSASSSRILMDFRRKSLCWHT